jgi:hypothetical protein
MKLKTSGIIAGVLLGGPILAQGARAVQLADWLPVDQDVWTIMMEEPQAHLLRAQEDLSNKDVKGAATEIRLAGTFLKLQEKKLAASSEQLNELAKGVESNQVASSKEVEETFNRAISALDQRQALIPVISGADTMYVDEADYHMAQAKKRLKKNDNKAAAGDIRRAEAYLKLEAVHAGEKAKGELLSSAAELEALAVSVEAGGQTAEKDLDRAFSRARKAVRSVL